MKKTRERNAQLKKTQSDRETATIEEKKERERERETHKRTKLDKP
jgi:hypothetical protein